MVLYSLTYFSVKNMKEESIKLILSIPPSINTAYSWYKVRHKSDKYKEWEKLAFFELQKQTKYKIKGDSWLFVSYTYYTPLFYKNWKKKVIDVFNYEKILSDFLSKQIDWFEDHKIKLWRVEKVDSIENIVKIEIKEI